MNAAGYEVTAKSKGQSQRRRRMANEECQIARVPHSEHSGVCIQRYLIGPLLLPLASSSSVSIWVAFSMHMHATSFI